MLIRESKLEAAEEHSDFASVSSSEFHDKNRRSNGTSPTKVHALEEGDPHDTSGCDEDDESC